MLLVDALVANSHSNIAVPENCTVLEIASGVHLQLTYAPENASESHLKNVDEVT